MSRSRRFVVAVLAVAVAVPFLAGGAGAQEERPPAAEPAPHDQHGEHAAEPAMSPEMAAEMAAWEAASRPGPQHQALAAMAGEWDLDLTFWMEPGGEPQKTTATASRQMTFGGRFLEENVTGDMMGETFLGRAVLGYDNVTGKWWSTWIDNHTTGLMVGEGDWDPESNAGTFHYTATDPVSGEKRQVKGVTKIHSADHEVHEMWEERGGETFKSMEIVYRRK
ncbi:MAG TPA: DUF1579 domain-containing protein [Thermoanaerobaculia bacterium]